MNQAERRKRLHTEHEYINIKKYKHRMSNLLKRYPESTPDKVIALAMMLPEEQVEVEYQRIVRKLRELMKVEA